MLTAHNGKLVYDTIPLGLFRSNCRYFLSTCSNYVFLMQYAEFGRCRGVLLLTMTSDEAVPSRRCNHASLHPMWNSSRLLDTKTRNLWVDSVHRFGDLALHELLHVRPGCLFFPSVFSPFSHNVCDDGTWRKLNEAYNLHSSCRTRVTH